MEQLFAVFLGYLQLYHPHLISVPWIGVLTELIFLILLKKRYTKYAEDPFGTIVCGLLLSFSVSMVITMTLYRRTPGENYMFRFIPFASYTEAFREGNVEILLQIIMNMMMFVPIGLFLPCCFAKFEKNKILFVTTLACSGGIELIQGITRIGMFELDDILGNVIGAEVGFLIWWGSRKWKNFVVS